MSKHFINFLLTFLTLSIYWRTSFSQKLPIKIGKIELLHETHKDDVSNEPLDPDLEKLDNDGPDGADEKFLTLKFSDILKSIGYDPNQILKASQSGDVTKLKKIRSFIRNKIAPIISVSCVADLLYFVDTLIEHGLAQHDMVNYCRQGQKANCTCARRVDEAIDESSWALNVLDSVGKFPSGFMTANFWMLGDFDECAQIDVYKNSKKHKWQGQYCRVDIFMNDKNWIDNMTSIMEKEFHEEIFAGPDVSEAFVFMPSARLDSAQCSNFWNFKIGTCFPRTCSENDIRAMAGIVINLPQRAAAKKAICNTQVTCHKELDVRQDLGAVIVSCFLIFVAVVMIFGTCYDYFVFYEITQHLPKSKHVDNLTHDDTHQKSLIHETREEYFERQSTFIKFILAFSVYSNGKKIFNTTQKPGQIHCLHGIRTLSLFWVILGHTYYWSVNYLDNPMAAFDLPANLLNQVILNASISVDAFYTLSAALIVFLWMKGMKKSKGKHVLSGGLWSMFYIHRYIRLTPVYVVIMVVDIFLVPYITDGPMWNQNGIEPNKCSNAWWTNLLYINNFFYLKEQCMTWSWYLANDMQFYVFSPPLLILLWKNHVIAIVVILLLLATTSIIRMSIILSAPDWPPISILINDPSKLSIIDDFWKAVYIKPYCRCGPFLVGMLLGYILYRCNLQIRMPRWSLILGWAVASILGFEVVFGLWDYSKTAQISSFSKAVYSALARPLWAISLSWVIFVCSTGHGGLINKFLSWKFWMPMSRLVYCAYLLHPIVIIVFYSAQMRPIHYSSHFHYAMFYVSHTFLSFFLALWASLAFELPVTSLEKLVFSHGPPKSKRLKPLINNDQLLLNAKTTEEIAEIRNDVQV